MVLQYSHRKHRKRRFTGTGIMALPGDHSAITRVVQPKLRVSQPDDTHEREADAMADRIMGKTHAETAAPDTGETVRRQCAECEEEEEARRVQRKAEPEEEDEEERLDTKADAHGTEGPVIESNLTQRIRSRRGAGQPLPDTERAFFEPRFGRDFSGVRIHTDGEAQQLSERINARAFTLGQDVFFNREEFRPGQLDSRRLMAHELTHTLQQSGSTSGLLRREVQPGRVSCEDTPRDYPIFNHVNTDTPTDDIQAAATRASRLLDNTINELEGTRNRIIGGDPAAWPTISDTVANSLRDHLRIDPEDRDSWTGTGPRTVHHALRWYRNVRSFLDSDAVNYTCIGPDCGSNVAYVYPGRSRIYLCPPWWNDGIDEQAVTLIHEAAHIYYDTEDSGRGMGSSFCLETFICEVNNLTVCYGCD